MRLRVQWAVLGLTLRLVLADAGGDSTCQVVSIDDCAIIMFLCSWCVHVSLYRELCDQCESPSTRTGQICSCAETPHSRLTQFCIGWCCHSLDTMESTGRQPAPNTPRLPSWTTALSWQARLGRSTITTTCSECLLGANSTARTHTCTHTHIPHNHTNNTQTQTTQTYMQIYIHTHICKHTYTQSTQNQSHC